jgi:hypothetical protein
MTEINNIIYNPYDFKNNVMLFNNKYTYLNNNNNKYDFSGNTIYTPNYTPPKTIQQGLKKDNEILLLQENTNYIIGTLTASTLLIFLVMKM